NKKKLKVSHENTNEQNLILITNVKRKGAEMDKTNEEKWTNQMQANTNEKA
ncbi:18727_t:CDS:2, partial [Dentiscutata erythropus]